MSTKTKGVFAIIAALIVLFSALWNHRIHLMASILLLPGYVIFKLMQPDV